MQSVQKLVFDVRKPLGDLEMTHGQLGEHLDLLLVVDQALHGLHNILIYVCPVINVVPVKRDDGVVTLLNLFGWHPQRKHGKKEK